MRKTVFAILMCLGATMLLASGKLQPLNIKPGLWQMTMTTTASGLPPIPADMQAKLAQMTPEQRARMEALMNKMPSGTPTTRTYKTCLTKEKLDKNPFADPKQNCTWSVLSSTGTRMDATGTCSLGEQGMKGDFDVHVEVINSENVKGTGKVSMTGGGHTMNMNYSATSKYLGADCKGTE